MSDLPLNDDTSSEILRLVLKHTCFPDEKVIDVSCSSLSCVKRLEHQQSLAVSEFYSLASDSVFAVLIHLVDLHMYHHEVTAVVDNAISRISAIQKEKVLTFDDYN